MSVLINDSEEILEMPDAYVAYSESGSFSVSDFRKTVGFVHACQMVMSEIACLRIGTT